MNKHNNTEKEKNKKYDGTYPIVFGKNVTIHPESLKILKTLGVKVDNIY